MSVFETGGQPALNPNPNPTTIFTPKAPALGGKPRVVKVKGPLQTVAPQPAATAGPQDLPPADAPYNAQYIKGHSPSSDVQQIAQLQVKLQGAGVYHSQIDGIMGPQTIAAMKAYTAQHPENDASNVLASHAPHVAASVFSPGGVYDLAKITGKTAFEFEKHLGDNAIYFLPALGKAVYDLQKGPGWSEVGRQWAQLLHGHLVTNKNDQFIHQDLPGMAKGLYEPFTKTPLNPDNLADDLFNAMALYSGGASGLSRLGAARSAFRETGGSMTAAMIRPPEYGGSFFGRPPAEARYLTLPNGAKVELMGAHNPGWAKIQKAYDKFVQRAIDKNYDGTVASHGLARARAYGEAGRRIEAPYNAALANALRAKFSKYVRNFNPIEKRAIELTSDNTPVDVRIAGVERELAAAQAAGDEAAVTRGVNELNLFKAIKEADLTHVIDHGDGTSSVVINAELHPKLALADQMVAHADELNSQLLQESGDMTAGEIRNRIDAKGQVVRGGRWQTYGEIAEQRLAASPARQAIVAALTNHLGPEDANTFMKFADEAAHAHATNHGEVLNPERYYGAIKGVSELLPHLNPEVLHQIMPEQATLFPHFETSLKPPAARTVAEKVEPMSPARSREIASQVIKESKAKGEAMPGGMDTVQALAKRIREVHTLAVQGAVHRDWYERAVQSMKLVANMEGYDVRTVTRLTAIYSQSAAPTANLKFVIQALREFRDKGTVDKNGAGGAAQRAKAIRILQGGDWQGMKTNSFYQNIAQFLPELAQDVTNPGGVTVDRHATTMMKATRVNAKGETVPLTAPGTRFYGHIERTFQAIANDLGWRPSDIQAASWVVYKADKLLARYPEWSKQRALHEARDAYESGVSKWGAQEQLELGLKEPPSIPREPDQLDILQHQMRAARGSDLINLPGEIKVGGFDRKIQFHSSKVIQELAKRFRTSPRQTVYRPVPEERGAKIAEWFDGAQDMSHDPETRAAYASFAHETLDQYHALVDAGYTFEFYPRDAEGAIVDPYPTGPRAAMLDLFKNKHLYVFPDEGGFGTVNEAAVQHPLLGDSGVEWGRPVSHNELFRGVHDVMGHFAEGVGFRADGEDAAFHSHRTMYSPDAQRAMASETRGQNSWVNFGPHGKKNRTAGQSETVYADQKAVLAPDWVIHAGAERPLHEVAPERAWTNLVESHAMQLAKKGLTEGKKKLTAGDRRAAQDSLFAFMDRNPHLPEVQRMQDVYSRAFEASQSENPDLLFQREGANMGFRVERAKPGDHVLNVEGNGGPMTEASPSHPIFNLIADDGEVVGSAWATHIEPWEHGDFSQPEHLHVNSVYVKPGTAAHGFLHLAHAVKTYADAWAIPLAADFMNGKLAATVAKWAARQKRVQEFSGQLYFQRHGGELGDLSDNEFQRHVTDTADGATHWSELEPVINELRARQGDLVKEHFPGAEGVEIPYHFQELLADGDLRAQLYDSLDRELALKRMDTGYGSRNNPEQIPWRDRVKQDNRPSWVKNPEGQAPYGQSALDASTEEHYRTEIQAAHERGEVGKASDLLREYLTERAKAHEAAGMEGQALEIRSLPSTEEAPLSAADQAMLDDLRNAMPEDFMGQISGPHNPESAIKTAGSDIKGAVRLAPDGVHLYTTPHFDFSTAVHEILGHTSLHLGVFSPREVLMLIRHTGREFKLRDVEGDAAKKAAIQKELTKAKTLEQLSPDAQRLVHEVFARQMESYFKAGSTTNTALKPFMTKAARAMAEIYGPNELPELSPRIRRIIERSYNRDHPTGGKVFGGEDPRFPGRNYLPAWTVEEKPGRFPNARKLGSTGVVAKAKSPMNKEPFTGAGFQQHMLPQNPAHLLAKRLMQNVRFLDSRRARQELARLGTDVLPAHADPRKYTLVNDQVTKPEKGRPVKVTNEAKKLLGLTEATYEDAAEVASRWRDFHSKLFVREDNAHQVLTPEQLKAWQEGSRVRGYKWVDNRLMGKDLRDVSGPQHNKLLDTMDAITNVEKNLVVYLKPGHIPTRVLANAGFNLIEGALNPANMSATWKIWRDLNEIERAQTMALGGQGYFQATQGLDIGLFHQIGHMGAEFYGRFVDNISRVLAVVLEARRHGIQTPEQFKEFLAADGDEARALRNRVGIKANRGSGDYARQSPLEQKVLSRYIFFYPWLKASSMFVGRAMLEHPIKWAALNSTGEYGKKWADETVGKVDSANEGLVGWADKHSPTGFMTEQSKGLNPFATPAEAGNTLGELFGANPAMGSNQLSAWMGPVPHLLTDIAFHLNPFGESAPPNERTPQIIYDDLLAGSPPYILLQKVGAIPSNPQSKNAEFPATATTQLERFGLGSGFPRPGNKDSINYEGWKQEADISGNSFVLDRYSLEQLATKAGVNPESIPPEIVHQMKARADLLAQIKKGMDSGHKALIAAQAYEAATGDKGYVELAHALQGNPTAAEHLYTSLRQVIYGEYLAYKRSLTAISHRLDAGATP